MAKVPKEMDIEFDPDDEEMSQTPPDVVYELGFDPALPGGDSTAILNPDADVDERQ